VEAATAVLASEVELVDKVAAVEVVVMVTVLAMGQVPVVWAWWGGWILAAADFVPLALTVAALLAHAAARSANAVSVVELQAA
jgi:N-acyl-D-aspartate/D-glutamate deacylase